MPQTDMVKTEQKKSQMMKFEVHQTINNVGQVVVNTNGQSDTPLTTNLAPSTAYTENYGSQQLQQAHI